MQEIKKKISDLLWEVYSLQDKIKNIENHEIENTIAIKELKNRMNNGNIYTGSFADIKSEKGKYISLYEGELGEWYKTHCPEGKYGFGCENFGSGVIDYLERIKPESLLDIGCGNGAFCIECKKFINKVYGLDIASVKAGKVIQNSGIKYIDSTANSIPLENNSVDFITGFDVLEHIPENLIDDTLIEINRVSKKGMIFSVSYDKCEYQGITMHNIIKPQEWWIKKLEKFGRVTKYGKTPHIANTYLIVFKGE